MHEHLSSVLTEKIEILTLVQDEATKDYSWVTDRRRWSSVKPDVQRNVFSAVGVGAHGVTIEIRPDLALTLHQAIRWNGEFFHLTSVVLNQAKDRQEIKAAFCTPRTLRVTPVARTGRDALNRPVVAAQPDFSFPGILAELYRQNEPDEIYRSGTLRRVLVTPKAIILRPGDLVKDGSEAPYVVRQVMDLELHKNEYIIERQEDI